MKRILIVDDNDSNREMLGFLFDGEGFQTKLLSDTDGIEQILKEESINMVLLDIMMGNSNGIEICKAIKLNLDFSDVKVLLMTASNAFNTTDLTCTLADGHIAKPFDIDDILTLVDSLIEHHN